MKLWIKIGIAVVMLMLLTVLFLSCTEESNTADGDNGGIENAAGGEATDNTGDNTGKTGTEKEDESSDGNAPSATKPEIVTDINSDKIKEPEEIPDKPATDAEGNEISYGDNDAQWKW